MDLESHGSSWISQGRQPGCQNLGFWERRDKMKRTHRAASIALLVFLSHTTLVQAAIHIDEVSIKVVQLRENGVVTGWEFTTGVHGGPGLLGGTITPAGKPTVNMIRDEQDIFNPLNNLLDLDDDDEFFTTFAMLEDTYPNNVTYTYAIEGFSGDSLSFTVDVDLPEFPVGFPSITNPDHLASGVPLNTILEWECTGCVGDYIDASTEDLPDGDLLDISGTYPVGSGSFDPGILEQDTAYEFDVTLMTVSFTEDALDLGANGIADLRLERGVSNIHIYSTASAVPVPAALWLFGSGLVGLIGYSKRKKAA